MSHYGVSRLMGLHYRSSHRRPFAIPANGFGGASNRNAFRWDEQCAVPVPKASMRPRSAYDEGRLIPSFADNVGIQLLVAEIRHRSEEHTSELQSRFELVCRLLLEKKKNNTESSYYH